MTSPISGGGNDLRQHQRVAIFMASVNNGNGVISTIISQQPLLSVMAYLM